MRAGTVTRSAVAAALAVTATGLGCIAEVPPEPEAAERHQMLVVRQLQPYIAENLEIDQLTPGAAADANLFTGPDPADGSRSARIPGPEGSRFVDWEDLASDRKNHHVPDLTDAAGVDLTAFPRSGGCLGPARVAPKADLVHALVANNRYYAYLAVLRASNAGDAGYAWILTREPPRTERGAAPCEPNEDRLSYDVSGPDPDSGALGDVLLVGHFRPGGEPLLAVYRATRAAKGLPPEEATDPDSDLWKPDPSGLAAVAVNTTPTDPGSFGAVGVSSLTPEGHLAPGIFAEAAIPMSVITGRTPCGRSFYATVVSRSSGASGARPDLKDLLGPVLFHVGRVQATARLLPSCRQELGYEAAAVGPAGEPLEGLACYWVFDTGEVSTDCQGTKALPVGAQKAWVRVEEPVSGCSDAVSVGPAPVFAPLSVKALATPTCQSLFHFGAEIHGGSNPEGARHAWRFRSTIPGLGAVSPDRATAPTGAAFVSPGGVGYTAELVITDARKDVLCQASDFVEVRPFDPLKLHLQAAPFAPECAPADTVLFEAHPGGGQPPYHFAWLGDVRCDDAPQCKVDAPEATCVDKQIQVALLDASGLCAPALSDRLVYSKRTVLSVVVKNDPRR